MGQSIVPAAELRPDPGREELAALKEARIGWRQRCFAWAVIGILVILGVFTASFADKPLVVVPGFFAMFGAAMFVINLMLATLLFTKGRIQKRGDSIRLGTAYLFVTLIIIAQMASFAGGFMPSPLIGTAETPLWLWTFWHLGFGLAITRYAWLAGQPASPDASLPLSISLVIVSSGVAAYVASTCTGILPTVMANGHFVYGGRAVLFWLPPTLATLAAFAAVARLGPTSPERLWLLVGLVASCLEVWLNMHVTARFTVGWYLAKICSVITSGAVLISLLHDITSLYGEAENNNRILRTLAHRDGLTGISNRRHFNEMLEEEFRRARRQETPLGLVMVDIDFFKGYNDHYGHQGGDECLRRVCAAVSDALWRPGDKVARYGGEELAILLPGTDTEGALLIAERVRAAVSQLGIEHRGSVHGVVTISAGVSSLLPCRGDENPSDLVFAADRGLYEAKRNGRNRVISETNAELDQLLNVEAWTGSNI